jgi:hypothetical protein
MGALALSACNLDFSTSKAAGHLSSRICSPVKEPEQPSPRQIVSFAMHDAVNIGTSRRGCVHTARSPVVTAWGGSRYDRVRKATLKGTFTQVAVSCWIDIGFQG